MTTTNAIGVTTAGGVAYTGTKFTGTALTAYSVLTGSSDTKNFAPLASLGSAGEVLTSAGAGAPPVWAAVAVGSVTWTDESANFAAAAGKGYFVTGPVVATLPATPSQGDTIYFSVETNSVTITANTGQKIQLGNVSSATAGTCESTVAGDAVTLVYRAANQIWYAQAVIGNWTIT